MGTKINVPFVDLQIQYHKLQKEILKTFQSVSDSSQFIKGSYLEDFEKNFTKFIGTDFCIGVASGTDALHLSLRSLNIGPGDEVILPVNTFVATAYAVLYVGARPVLVDIDENTFNIDTYKIEKLLTKKTKAIIPVHLYGQPANMRKIMQIAKRFNLLVIEDAAQAHGAEYKRKNVGTFGSVAAFSFYPSKNLGAFGDAGAIVTNSKKLAQRLKRLREYGSTTKYLFDELGFNSRLDSLQAAILNIKLKYLPNWNKKRQKAAKYYSERISREITFIKTPQILKDISHVFHLYVIRTPQRNRLLKFLSSQGIQTAIHYPKPLHLQKSLKFLGYKKGDFPIAEKLSGEILSLPMYPELTTKQQDFVVESIKGFFKI